MFRTTNTIHSGIMGALILISCAATIGPVELNKQFNEPFDPADASSIVATTLQDYGYTILVINEKTGTITTDWKQESKRIVLWGSNIWRTRISVTLSLQNKNIIMKIFKQKYDDDEKLWKEISPSEGDKETIDTILNDIELKIRGLRN